MGNTIPTLAGAGQYDPHALVPVRRFADVALHGANVIPPWFPVPGDGTAESTGVVRATIDRVAYLGFEVRVELTSATNGSPFTAQITRGDAEALGLKEGDTVFVRATRVPPIAGEVQVAAG